MKAPPRILVVDDDDAFRGVLTGELARLSFEVAGVANGIDAVRRAREADPEVILLDLQLPDMNGLEVLKRLREEGSGAEVILLTGHGSIDSAIEAIRIGAFDYVAKPCPLDELEVRIQRALESGALRKRAGLLERGLTPRDPGDSFVGESPAFRSAVELIRRVAPSDSHVLLTGETGSGKEMAAKLLHARSLRSSRPFVVVECASLQEDLLQSELFGHERGAFTGADRTKPGLFEVADGGTVFLDEIGEVNPPTQVKLLRVLDTGTFRHVGGTKEIGVDIRVIAATNRDLASMVKQSLFREDLYYRLVTVPIELPPLRARGADVELLARHFADRFNRRYGFAKRLDGPTVEALSRYDWPGNVRELLHVIEAAMLVGDGEAILPSHLPDAVTRAGPAAEETGEGLPSLRDLERAHIEKVLRATQGHRSRAAAILGISERNLYRKIREYDIED